MDRIEKNSTRYRATDDDAVVHDNTEWHELFTQDELQRCEKRLADYVDSGPDVHLPKVLHGKHDRRSVFAVILQRIRKLQRDLGLKIFFAMPRQQGLDAAVHIMDEGDRVVVDWMVDLGPRLSKMTALLQANDPGRQEEFALGAIRAGFLADFIILPRDPFETDVRSIHGMVPAAAIVAGELRSGALARAAREAF